jgi:hypothetical protein
VAGVQAVPEAAKLPAQAPVSNVSVRRPDAANLPSGAVATAADAGLEDADGDASFLELIHQPGFRCRIGI